jgi:hypothetical protein
MTRSWIRRQLLPWTEWLARQQAQRRREQMLRASPELRRRAENHARMMAGHKPSRAAWVDLRDATTDMLRRGVRHG